MVLIAIMVIKWGPPVHFLFLTPWTCTHFPCLNHTYFRYAYTYIIFCLSIYALLSFSHRFTHTPKLIHYKKNSQGEEVKWNAGFYSFEFRRAASFREKLKSVPRSQAVSTMTQCWDPKIYSSIIAKKYAESYHYRIGSGHLHQVQLLLWKNCTKDSVNRIKFKLVIWRELLPSIFRYILKVSSIILRQREASPCSM